MRGTPASWDDAVGSLEIASLRGRYARGDLRPVDVVAVAYARIEAYADPALFISLTPVGEAMAAAEALGVFDPERPLWGIPCALKDNIDAAGLPTTLGCPEVAFSPGADAPAVAALRASGAIILGKTNLDQFATGLNGTRSPYGTPRSPFDPGLIPGGSSSGSAVAVSAGIVSFALGTDTAGSGRVPAALGSIVGLKPSRGLVSSRGVYPACASLDCVSVFALTVTDAAVVLSCIGGLDRDDPYSRPLAAVTVPVRARSLRGRTLAVPAGVDDEFFGDAGFGAAWLEVLRVLASEGVCVVEVDLGGFFAAGAMLYGGAWLAERYGALRPLLDAAPTSADRTVAAVVSRGAEVTAADVFASLRTLEGLKRDAHALLGAVDALLVPTIGGVFTVEQMREEPVARNQRLGRFTTFTNLLDLAAVSIPAGFAGAVPFGITIQAAAGGDVGLMGLAASIERVMRVPLGAPRWGRALEASVPMRGAPRPILASERATASMTAADASFEVAVVGAHLRGQPLHPQLIDLGARYVREARTSADYRLYVLPATVPAKPGLVRRAAGTGAAIEVEVYALGAEALGVFLAGIPSPLGLGRIGLDDGSECLGFVCEDVATVGATDITELGGWRAFVMANP